MILTSSFDWQAWLACSLGALAALHLARRWWPHKGHKPAHANHDAQAIAASCTTAQAPAAKGCQAGACPGCGTATTPIRVHRKVSPRAPGPSSGL